METMETMRRRQSCRAYLPRQITDSALETLLQAANAAPAGMGQYDRIYLTVLQDPALLKKLDACAARFLGDPALRPTYGAPTVILVSTARETPADAACCNAGCIMENMHLAAMDLGLGSVYLLGCAWGLRQDAALQRALQLPEEFVPASALAVGYAAQALQERTLTTERIKTACLR